MTNDQNNEVDILIQKPDDDLQSQIDKLEKRVAVLENKERKRHEWAIIIAVIKIFCIILVAALIWYLYTNYYSKIFDQLL